MDIDCISKIFSYDPITGIILRKTGRNAGKVATYPRHDSYGIVYFRVSVANTKIDAHRIAWALYYGSWPAGMIDHINGNPQDNRITNLRDVGPRDNSVNNKRRRLGGVTGAYLQIGYASRWRSVIRVNGKQIYLGTYGSQEEAGDAYEKARDAIEGRE
jgi:hypothetical protein